VHQRVVVIHYVQKGGEAPIVVVAVLVRSTHEQALFAYEDHGEVHRLVLTVGSAICFERVHPNVFRLVQVSARLGPKLMKGRGSQPRDSSRRSP